MFLARNTTIQIFKNFIGYQIGADKQKQMRVLNCLRNEFWILKIL